MKSLIQSSIKPAVYDKNDKTIFNTEEKNRSGNDYTKISDWPNRTMYWSYDYTEGGVIKSDSVKLKMPADGSEESVKNFVLQMISIKLNS